MARCTVLPAPQPKEGTMFDVLLVTLFVILVAVAGAWIVRKVRAA